MESDYNFTKSRDVRLNSPKSGVSFFQLRAVAGGEAAAAKPLRGSLGGQEPPPAFTTGSLLDSLKDVILSIRRQTYRNVRQLYVTTF